MAAGQASESQAATPIVAFIALAAIATGLGLIFGRDALIGLAVVAFASALLSSDRETLGAFCLILFVPIYLATLWVAFSSTIPAIVTSMFLPGFAQAYWVWDLLAAGKPLAHPLILMCGAWLILFGTWIAKSKFNTGLPESD